MKEEGEMRLVASQSRKEEWMLVLVADDDLGVRETLLEVLTMDGHEVILAGDGQEAIDAVSAHAERLKLVITDATMPRRRGEEVARWVKTHFPHIKVIGMSGEDPSVICPVFRAAGADAILPKPFSVEEVREATTLALSSPKP